MSERPAAPDRSAAIASGIVLVVVVALLAFAALVALVVWLVTRSSSRAVTPPQPAHGVAAGAGYTPPSADEAINLVRMRYARGEISRAAAE